MTNPFRSTSLPALGAFALSSLVAACDADPAPPFVFDASAEAMVDPVDGGPPDAADMTLPPRPDAGPPPELPVVVYAHSGTTLFAVDPERLTFRAIGDFALIGGGTLTPMLDLAVDRHQDVWGVTRQGLYRIDPEDAAVMQVVPFETETPFNGLTFLPAGMLGSTEETLIGDTGDGEIFRIDTETGVRTLLGHYETGYVSSGDLVAIRGEGVFSTVKQPDNLEAPDLLVRLNPETGGVEVVGDTNVPRIFGLGYWRHVLYGFTRDGVIVQIDIDTGEATPILEDAGVGSFFGAGVTTIAPIAPF